MSCDITLGRLEGCKSYVGGLDAIYLVNFGTLGDVTLGVNNEITDVAGSTSAYKYDLKASGNTFEQTPNSSRDNGTTFWSQALNLVLKGLTMTQHKEIVSMVYGRPQIVVEDRNGNAFLIGLERGAEVTGGSIVTGGAMGDLSGYTLTFTGEEKQPANFINGAVKGDPFAGMTTGVITIVEGV